MAQYSLLEKIINKGDLRVGNYTIPMRFMYDTLLYFGYNKNKALNYIHQNYNIVYKNEKQDHIIKDNQRFC